MKSILKIILCLSISGFISAQEYHVKKSEDNLVKFISDAPIEDFEGITDNIDGYLYLQNADFSGVSELYFEVDLRTLDTGIGLRNRHMRDNYLETDDFPMAAYSGKIANAKQISKNRWQVDVSGKMKIHGVERAQKISGEISFSKKGVKIESKFNVKLSDHKIDIPSLMFYKIDEEMHLEVNFKLDLKKE